MTSPPAPPKRHRRRIVVVVAVLVLGLGWWFWPAKVDPRFVGRWVRFLPDHNELGAHFFEFDANGGGSYGSNNIDHMHFTWSVKGSYLTIQYGRKPGLQGLAERLLGMIVFADPPRHEPESQRFFISNVTANRIIWQPLLDGQITPVEGFDVFHMSRVRLDVDCDPIYYIRLWPVEVD